VPIDKIEIEGLKDFARELRRLDKAWGKELRTASKDAADIAADATRSSFASRGGVAPKVAASVKVLAQQRGASIRIGGDRYPYAMGSNFGSKRYAQFPPVASPDYSLYKSIRAKRPEVVDAFGDAIDRLVKRAFPN
jgi:hypothetical protein